MIFRPVETRGFDTFALGIWAARPEAAANRQVLKQRDRARQRIEAAFMRHRAAEVGDRADQRLSVRGCGVEISSSLGAVSTVCPQ